MAGCNSGQTEVADAGPDAIAPDDFSSLATTVEDERVKLGAAGVAVEVVHHGVVVFAQGFGTRPLSSVPIQTSTLFRVSSVAKAWTAIAALALVEQGKLSLDDKVTSWIPGFALQGSPPELDNLTLRQLLRHRSGIYDGVADGSQAGAQDDGYLERYVTSPPFAATYYFMTPPDRTFNYTNVEYSIAGSMLEKASGAYYRDLAKQLVFSKLGMNRILCTPDEILADGDYTDGQSSTTLVDPAKDWSPANYPSGGGSACHASADDLAKLARFLLQGDSSVLSATSLASTHDDALDTDQPWVGDVYHGYHYGYGSMVYDGVVIDGGYYPMTLYGHEGADAGYTALMYVVPQLELAFIALSNRGNAYFDSSFARAMQIAKLPAAGATPPTGVDPSLYAHFEGHYFEPRVLGDVTVYQSSGKLYADISGMAITGRELLPEHGTGFELQNVMTENGYYDHYVRFIDDAAGNAELVRNRYWVAARVP